VKAIAEELGNLPVALVQAGSYMLQTECSCEEYLDRLHQHKAEMPAGDRLHRSAYRAFDLPLQRIRPQVRSFLHIIGCLHYANFPIKAIIVAANTEFRFDQFSLVEHEAVREPFEEHILSRRGLGRANTGQHSHQAEELLFSKLHSFIKVSPSTDASAHARMDVGSFDG
jgi:hypothetical protein